MRQLHCLIHKTRYLLLGKGCSLREGKNTEFVSGSLGSVHANRTVEKDWSTTYKSLSYCTGASFGDNAVASCHVLRHVVHKTLKSCSMHSAPNKYFWKILIPKFITFTITRNGHALDESASASFLFRPHITMIWWEGRSHLKGSRNGTKFV